MRNNGRSLLSAMKSKWVLFSAALLPCVSIIWLVTAHWVDVPYADHWWIAPFFNKLAQGTLTVGDLFAPQVDHRQFFPNLLFVALGRMTGWDIRYELAVIVLLACFVSYVVYRLGALTVEGAMWKRLLVFLVANCLIFSARQYPNWLFGVQVVYFVPVACLAACLLLAYSNARAWVKTSVGMCLATVSTFSCGNGIVCWIAVLPMLILAQRGDDKDGTDKENDKGGGSFGKRWLLPWAAGAALCAALYLYDFQRTAAAPSLTEAAVSPAQAVFYLLAFLGSPLSVGVHVPPAAIFIGVALTLLYVAACLYWFVHRDDRDLSFRMAGWMTFGAYSVSTGIMVTIGRCQLGVWHAIISRYITFSLYLAVALVYLLPIIYAHARRKKRFPLATSVQMYAPHVAATIVGALVAWHTLVFVLTVPIVRSLRSRMLYEKAALSFINFVPLGDDSSMTDLVEAETMKRDVNGLDRLGLLRPGLVKSLRIQEIARPADENASGAFETLDAPERGVWVASGWAFLPQRGEAADAVILTYDSVETNGTEALVFALCRTETERPDVARSLDQGNSRYASSGWRKSFVQSDVPTRPIRLRAWAYDAMTGVAYPLTGAHLLQD